MIKQVYINKDNFHISGRVKFNEDKSASFWWANSGFSFKTNAKSFDIILSKYLDKLLSAYVVIEHNGIKEKFEVNTTTEKIHVEFNDDESVVSFTKITDPEAELNIKRLDFCGENLKIEPLPHKSRRLLFIGDSITNGFGVIGPKDKSVYDPIDSDSTQTYAYMLAKYFDAEIMNQCFSGRGIVNDCNGSRESINLREVFSSITCNKEEYDFNEYIPDLVFINAGTNDSWGGVNRDEFKEKCTELLCKIRKVYPKAPIIYFYGAMDQELYPTIENTVIEFKKNSENVELIHTESISKEADELGSVGHPNVKANIRFFNEILLYFKKYLN